MSENKDFDGIKSIGLFLSAGITMAASIAAGYFVGSWLDQYLGTTPWLTLLMFLLGVAAGMKSLYDLAFPKNGKK